MNDLEFTLHSAATIIYALVAILIGFLSLIGIFILVKHGDNKSFALALSALYALLFVAIVSSSLAIIYS